MSAHHHRALAGALAAGLILTGCATKPVLSAHSERLRVVTTTGLIRDLVANVGGGALDVVSLVPDGADPHSYEPTMRDARNVVYADVAFSNYAMLEEQSVIKALDANLADDAVSVALAEEAVKYAAEIIPLVENVNLDTIWLGLRAQGSSKALGATRTSNVLLSVTGVEGPGSVFTYLTGTFGDTEIYLNSADGFDATNGYRDDTMSLPAGAHTHLSWVFTEPGVYRLDLQARLQVDDTSRPIDLDTASYTFAVGVDPSAAGNPEATVLDRGHADLSVDLDTSTLGVRYDPSGGGEHTQQTLSDGDVVIHVPAKGLAEVPAGPQFSFLGKPGEAVYQLPQAVLGKHVHGEIDPHLWQDVGNTMAYVNLIRDTLIAADPDNALTYRRSASAHLDKLEATDAYVTERIGSIPAANRHLVTTHDAFGYLAHAYGIEIAGFVTPNPAIEPSLSDRRKLTETIRSLHVEAVFLEPNLVSRSSVLMELAHQHGIRVCPIYGDAFDEHVHSYIDMMRANADSLATCLTP